MKFETTNGYFFEVSDEDAGLVMARSWAYCSSGSKSYVRATNLYLHRAIMNPPSGLVVDHINGDTLDNRRGNLRICTQQMNIAATRNRSSASGFRGVYRPTKKSKKWRASIGFEGKTFRLGHFKDPEDAARAYNQKAFELYGEFAVLNDIPGDKK